MLLEDMYKITLLDKSADHQSLLSQTQKNVQHE